jgi:hypothetical protein
MEGFATCWLTDVYAGNTVEQMLIGNKFNGVVREFTLVCYSLKIIHIADFIYWCRTFDHFEEIHDVFLELSCFTYMIRKFVTRLYDQMKNCQTSHHDMNKWRVNFATGRDARLVRLPPLKQH